ncbi:MAG: nuclease-related domain-containing protein [Thermomicrobiales bacterium]
MRIVRNTAYVQRRRRLARWSAFGGFVLLVSTFFLAFRPALILIAYALLLVGFVIFNFGMQQLGKWSRNPRNDAILDVRLQPAGDSKTPPLSDRFVLVHYGQVGKRVVEHLLIYPGGVLVLTARELPGLIHGRGNRWRKRGGGLTRFFAFSGPQLGNPSLETDQSVAAVESLLETESLEVEVSGAIAFLNPMAELDIEEPDYACLRGDELLTFIRSLEEDPSVTNADRDRLIELLGGGASEETQVRTRRPVKVKRRAA